MIKQAIRKPFPWPTADNVVTVLFLATIAVGVVILPVLTFHFATANTTGRVARNPEMKPVEDRAFTTCYSSTETASCQIAAKLDTGSLMDLKYRLVEASVPTTGANGMDPAQSIDFDSIISLLDRMIAQKSSAGVPAR